MPLFLKADHSGTGALPAVALSFGSGSCSLTLVFTILPTKFR